MIEAGKLSIIIDASTEKLELGLKKARGSLSKFRNKANSAIGSMAKFSAGAAVAGLSLAGMQLVSVTRKFDILNAGLKTATGSAEGANKAFEAIQDFAAKTPFSLQTATDAFIKLKNLGLDPSEKAMLSYGNTASALGKDLNQMIEAVADAATGEFERLKEFGIKTKSQGDNVSFTFQGVTTTVKKNASEIEGYLKSLGENQFAGAMQERVKTLDGAMSNLGDTWDKLFLSISQSGIGSKITEGTNLAISGLENLINGIKSGQVEAVFNGFTSKFAGIVNASRQGFNVVNQFFAKSTSGWGSMIKDTMKFIVDSFKNMPENIKAFIDIMNTNMISFVKKTLAYGKAIYQNLTFWKEKTFDLDKELKQIDETRERLIDKTLKEHEASIKSFDDQIVKANELRKEFEKLNIEKSKGTGDRLAEFRIPRIEAPEDKKLEGKEKESLTKKLEALKQSFMLEDELRVSQYNKKLEDLKLGLENELITQQQYNTLKEQEEARHLQEMSGLRKSSFNSLTNLVGKQYGKQAGLVAGAMQDIVSSTATYSKKAFEIQKGAAIANAVINTSQGITKTLSSYPWPVAGVLAAAHAAAGFAQIRSIKAQTFSGGSSGSSSVPSVGSTTTAGGSIPTTADQGSSQLSGQSVNISLSGEIFGREQIRGLISQINEALSDGAQLNIV